MGLPPPAPPRVFLPRMPWESFANSIRGFSKFSTFSVFQPTSLQTCMCFGFHTFLPWVHLLLLEQCCCFLLGASLEFLQLCQFPYSLSVRLSEQNAFMPALCYGALWTVQPCICIGGT